MDILEKFFKKYSYKFEKGYPNMDNQEDIKLLESLISELVNENFTVMNEQTDAEEGLEILKKELDLSDDKYLRQSGTTYKVLVPRPERKNYVELIDKIDGFEYDGSMPGSSMGGIRYKGARFLVKPVGRQGRSAPGLDNEDVLVNNVRKYLDEGAKNVIFKGENKNYVCSNVVGIEDVGLDVAGGKKADVIIEGKISGVIVTDLPDREESSIIFGSDNAVVIYGTYLDSSFKLEGENLIIKVGKILEDLDDVEEFNLEPVLNIRHDSTRQGQRGLRSIVEPEILVYKGGDKPTGNRIEISYNELIG